MYKTIGGIKTEFNITLQPKYKADAGEDYWEKIIDVTQGNGFGPSANWTDALEFARELSALKTS